MLTLSCKNRLTCAPQEAARRLPRLTRSGGRELQPGCRARACGAAGGGAPPGQRTGGFCQLVRAVSQRSHVNYRVIGQERSNQIASNITRLQIGFKTDKIE